MEFSILVQNRDLEMDLYTLNFSQVLLAKQGGSELSPRTTWSGHRSPAVQVVASTVSRLQEPYVATRTTNEIGFWRILSHPVFVESYSSYQAVQDTTQPLKQTHMAFHEQQITDIAWVAPGRLSLDF